MTPHLCPKCQGERRLMDSPSTDPYRTCPTCKGEGVLWEPVSIPSVWTGGDEPSRGEWTTSGAHGTMIVQPDGTTLWIETPGITFTPTTGAT